MAVVVLTYNRRHLLQRCVEDVLQRASPLTSEIVIWDNASTDGTREYLSTLDDARIRVVLNEENIGQNAYAEAFRLTTADYLVELDDDVIEAPLDWDRTLLEALVRLPDFGFLAASLIDDPHDSAANAMYHERWDAYTETAIDGIRLLLGPTGGGCAITPRELNERVGGFRQQKETFWLEDEAYIADIEKLGYRAGYLADLQVHHAGGPYYAEMVPAKARFWADYHRRVRRRTAVKLLLVAIPFVRLLNERHEWFSIPNARRSG